MIRYIDDINHLLFKVMLIPYVQWKLLQNWKNKPLFTTIRLTVIIVLMELQCENDFDNVLVLMVCCDIV